MTVAMGKMSKSAHEAIDLGFGKPGDTILFNARELLFVALKEARLLADAGYVRRCRRAVCRWPGAPASPPWR